MNRIHEGYCIVPNPFNPKQKTKQVSLLKEDVDFIVFWTRNPKPMFPHLDKLDRNGYRYYFMFTILDYPKQIETLTPPLTTSINSFKSLSDKIGAEKVIWRYDPILFNKQCDIKYHIDIYKKIAQEFRGYTTRSIISIVDIYRKVTKRMETLNSTGMEFSDHKDPVVDNFDELMHTLASIAGENGMEITSCAETPNLRQYGIKPGKCIDNDYIKKHFGIDVTEKKDPSQRKACGCVASKDIGMYNTCQFGCQYCYATNSFEKSKLNYKRHDSLSSSLI